MYKKKKKKLYVYITVACCVFCITAPTNVGLLGVCV